MTIVVGNEKMFAEKAKKILEKSITETLREEVDILFILYDELEKLESEEKWYAIDKIDYEDYLRKRRILYSKIREQEKKIVEIMKHFNIEEYVDSRISICIRYPPWNHYL